MLLRGTSGRFTGFPSWMIPDSSSSVIDMTWPLIVAEPASLFEGQSSEPLPKLHGFTNPNQTSAWVKPSSVENPSCPSSTQASLCSVPSIVVVWIQLDPSGGITSTSYLSGPMSGIVAEPSAA